MKVAITISLAVLQLSPYVMAVPAPLEAATTTSASESYILSSVVPTAGVVPSDVPSLVSAIEGDFTEASEIASAFIAVFEAAVQEYTPTSIPEVTSIVASIYGSPTPTVNLVTDVVELIYNGITPQGLEDALSGYVDPINSSDNDNTEEPDDTIYPQKSSEDAPYSVSEADLRGAIYIPSTYEYGNGSKVPVILSPGTGATGGICFSSNFIALLSESDFADPVWLNIPGKLLGDAQVNAEYVAYAINYISGISNNVNVSVITWSQGSLDAQWALKYWPSTRSVVSDFIPISPDFHGTVLAYLLCPDFPILPCDPAILQQEYSSNFVATLRANGGDSAYVPTTTVYSIYDEIVQPQIGTNASGYILDSARGVGVSNNELQLLCPALPAGGFYTHEAVLYNPVAYALAVDAITHDGPGDPSRIDLSTLCEEIVAENLGLTDVIATEGLLAVAAVNEIVYFPKLLEEPAIMAYAA